MTNWLKQSTAVDIALGPFVDSVDGVTAKTALTIAQADVRLKKNAANWAQKNNASSATHEENGWYEVNFSTTDTDTLGILQVAVTKATALPVWKDYVVVAANIYDSLIGGGDILDVSANQILGTAISTPATAGILDVNLKNIVNVAVSTTTAQLGVNQVQVAADATAATNQKNFFNGTGYAGTNNVIPVVTTVNGLGAAVITAASIAADAINDSKVAADVTIASVTGSVGSVTGAVGSVTGAVGSVTGNVGGNVVGSVASVTGNVGGNVVGSVASVTGNVTGSVGSLGATAKTDVKLQMTDALNVDTYAEPGLGTPSATISLAQKIGYIYKAWRNRSTQNATTYKLFNTDGVTVDHKSTVSDDGTTFDRTVVVAGP